MTKPVGSSRINRRPPRLSFAIATEDDASEIVELRNSVAEHLADRHGRGHWSGSCTDRGVLLGIRTSRVLVARQRGRIVGVLRLATKKPWAIDVSYFVKVPRALYLLDMAVKPSLQQQGIGRRMLDEAAIVARDWPAQAIRLDAYEGRAGAGAFYAACGYREVGRVVYRGVPLIYFEMLL